MAARVKGVKGYRLDLKEENCPAWQGMEEQVQPLFPLAHIQGDLTAGEKPKEHLVAQTDKARAQVLFG
jgi:hypothetical protein